MKVFPAFREFPRRHLDRPTGPPNPFESYLLVICIIQGAAVLFGFARPGTIESALTECLRFVWATLLLLGGSAAVIGLYWPWDAVDSILIKRVGLWAAGGGTLAYGVALFTVGAPGVVAGLFNLGFALACFTRAAQVSVALTRFRAELAVIRTASVTPIGRGDDGG